MTVQTKMCLAIGLALILNSLAYGQSNIKHDAEHYILLNQNRGKWAAEDKAISEKLAALEKKYGQRPNIIHIMWDDTSLGEFGSPVFNKIRGYETPRLNKMARDGITFARMYTEPSCTPTRAAALTGRLSKRSAMFKVEFPIEGSGLHGPVSIPECEFAVGSSVRV